MDLNFFLIGFLLISGHYMGDFAFQSQYMADGKSPIKGIPGVPWQHVLFGHAAIHGGLVAFITQTWWLGGLELCAHALIDYHKCHHRLSFAQDQFCHLGCKALWLLLLWLSTQ